MQENPFLFRGSWHHYFLRIIYQRGNIWKIEPQLPRQQCSHSSRRVNSIVMGRLGMGMMGPSSSSRLGVWHNLQN